MDTLELIFVTVIVFTSTVGIVVCARLGAKALFSEPNKRDQ